MSTQPSASARVAAARAAGMRDAVGVPAAATGAGLLGFGAFAFDAGFSIWVALACTAGIWALPGQIILIEMSVAGAPGIATVIAVMLTGARFLPMTLALMPLVRGERDAPLTVYGAAQLVAMTSWAWTMRRAPDMPREERLAYFIGFGSVCLAVSLVTTVIGYYLADLFPPLLSLGFVFLNPLYLVVLLVGEARTRLAAAALACGAVAGPLMHLVTPEWSILLTGLIGGTAAYIIQRLWKPRYV